MIKRLVWFVAGAVGGAAGTVIAGRRVKRSVRNTVDSLGPVKVARRTGRRVRTSVEGVSDAIREGRTAMRDKEFELKARLEGRVSRIDPSAAVFVDGDRVTADEVVIVSNADDSPRPSRRASRDAT